MNRHNPSSIVKILNLNILVLGEHKLVITLEHLILGNICMNLREFFAKKETYV